MPVDSITFSLILSRICLLTLQIIIITLITFGMEATQFGYSTKNIPIPSENDYKKVLIEKTEHLCKRI